MKLILPRQEDRDEIVGYAEGAIECLEDDKLGDSSVAQDWHGIIEELNKLTQFPATLDLDAASPPFSGEETTLLVEIVRDDRSVGPDFQGRLEDK